LISVYNLGEGTIVFREEPKIRIGTTTWSRDVGRLVKPPHNVMQITESHLAWVYLFNGRLMRV
jgi:hypothetical protein